MKHRVLNLLTGLSLLVCVAVVVLWVRSYRVFDELYFLEPAQTSGRPSYDVRRVASGRGRISLTHYRSSGMQDTSEPSVWASSANWGLHFKSYPAPPITNDLTTAFWSWGGYSFQNTTQDPYRFAFFWRVTFPIRLLAIVAAVASVPLLAVQSWWRVKRSARRKRGHCPACGYDLRATPERCPECGAPASAKAGK